jgi:predicted Zn-dependent peptidase
MLPEFLGPSLELLADMLRPSLREEDFETERQVIIEEIRMYDDQPPYGADERCEALHFGAHPLANSVLGSVASIEALSVDQMREYFRQRYCPSNITLVATGKLDFDSLLSSAEKFCGNWEPAATTRAITAPVRHPGFSNLCKEASTQEYCLELAAAPWEKAADRYAADLLTTILGDNSGSRLYWELIDTGEAEQAGMYYVEYQGAGLFWTMLSCHPDKVERNLQVVHDVFQGAAREGITAKELEQAKNKTKAHAVISSERPMRRLRAVGGNWIQHGSYLSLREELNQVSAVTISDIMRLLEEYPLSAATTVAIGPRAELQLAGK